MIRKQVKFQSNEACEKQLMFTIAEWEHDTLPKTNSLPLKIWSQPRKEGKDRLPTISFQGVQEVNIFTVYPVNQPFEPAVVAETMVANAGLLACLRVRSLRS